jgi:dethiobiotin synthetase
MINHVLLTLSALRAAAVPVAGVVINHTHPTTPDTNYLREDNIRSVAHYGAVEILAVLPYISGFNPGLDEHWQILEAALRPGILGFLAKNTPR